MEVAAGRREVSPGHFLSRGYDVPEMNRKNSVQSFSNTKEEVKSVRVYSIGHEEDLKSHKIIRTYGK